VLRFMSLFFLLYLFFFRFDWADFDSLVQRALQTELVGLRRDKERDTRQVREDG
jgi:hypothetical protein